MCHHHQTQVSNIVIIGAGAAGLRAALAAKQQGCDVVVVGKRLRHDAHSVLAAGGINAALGTVDPQDSWQQHFADTWREGCYLGHPEAVQILAQEAPTAVRELADWGCAFARTPTGQFDQRFFGAHTWRRTCYVGDYTGRAIMGTLLKKIDELRIPIYEQQYVSRLLVYEGVCYGLLAFDLQSGQRTLYLADAVILATGGHTRLWSRSSARRDENMGDGMGLALAAGCELMDMELVQFHPTGMVAPPEMVGTLVTEAVRGEGGRLFNQAGERFMQRYDPERLELSTRDRVALANYTEISQGRGGPNGGVFLDISHQPKELILQKLPHIYRQFIEAQLLDISQQPMEVAPTAHYSMGGVKVDPATHATKVAGLYAVGEVAGGLHGANRLGGNSLSETLVFGRRAGEAAAHYSALIIAQLRGKAPIVAAHDELNQLMHQGSELARPLQQRLRTLLWEYCGVVRTEQQLQLGLQQLADLHDAAAQVDVRPSVAGYQDLAQLLDLHFGLVSAEATLRCALARRESRGAQQRQDFPQLDPALQVNFVISQTADGTQQLRSQTIPAIPPPLQPWVKTEPLVVLEDRLLK